MATTDFTILTRQLQMTSRLLLGSKTDIPPRRGDGGGGSQVRSRGQRSFGHQTAAFVQCEDTLTPDDIITGRVGPDMVDPNFGNDNADPLPRDPKSFQPVPAAAGPAIKPWKQLALPDLESSSPGLIGIPIDQDSAAGTNVSIKQHMQYPDDSVALQVEDTVYHVSAKSLKASSKFVQLFGKRKVGDKTPIKLNHVTVFEMDSLLRLLEGRILYDEPLKFDLNELIAILRLSTGWNFVAARNWAIKELAKIQNPALKRLELAHTYRVKDWLEPAYFELCSQVQTWTAQDTSQVFDMVGISGLHTLMTLREDYVRNNYQAVHNGYNTTGTTAQSGTPSAVVINRIKAAIASSATLALRGDN